MLSSRTSAFVSSLAPFYLGERERIVPEFPKDELRNRPLANNHALAQAGNCKMQVSDSANFMAVLLSGWWGKPAENNSLRTGLIAIVSHSIILVKNNVGGISKEGNFQRRSHQLKTCHPGTKIKSCHRGTKLRLVTPEQH
jgi:hypothetical protein